MLLRLNFLFLIFYCLFIFEYLFCFVGFFYLCEVIGFCVFVSQVGSYFVGQYYQVLRQQPDLVHQFYSDSSSMIRVDGDYTETAPDVLVIYIIIYYFSIKFGFIFQCD